MRLPMEDRVKAVKSAGLCLSCFKKGHVSRFCRNRAKCESCDGNHPTLFHGRMFGPANRASRNSSPRRPHAEDSESEATHELTNRLTADVNAQTSVSPTVRSSAAKSDSDGVCLSVVPVQISTEHNSVITYAFLDSGSTTCFITNELYEQLRPPKREVKNAVIELSTVRRVEASKCKVVTNLIARDLDGRNPVKLPEVYTLERLPANADDIPSEEVMNRWPHLRNVQVPRVNNCEVGLLIGQNVPEALRPYEIIDGGDSDGPFAMRTKLGWIVQGLPTQISSSTRVASVKTTRVDKLLVDLYNKEFEDLDAFQVGESVEDQRWRKVVSDGCTLLSNGKYEVPLPLRDA